MFIQEILDIFGKIPDDTRKNLILDNYRFKEGIYILVHKDLSFDIYSVDNKSEMNIRVRDLFAKYDYYSNYINSNKSIDSTYKNIYSANPFTYFTKISVSKDEFVKGKFGTLNPKYFNDIYFNKLKNVYHMNLDENFIFFLENKIDDVFLKLIDLGLIKEQDLDKNDTHIKFFYETDANLYEQEYKKYEEQKIFNSNNSNIEMNGVIFGTSNFSNSYDSDRKFACPRTSPSSVPFRVSINEARILKDFAQWIKNCKSNFIQIGYNDNFRNQENYNFGYIIQTSIDKKGMHIVSFDNYGIKERDKKKYINHNMNHLFIGRNNVIADNVEQVLNYYIFNNGFFPVNQEDKKTRLLNKNYFSSTIEGIKNKKIELILKENRYMIFNHIYRNKPINMDFIENDISNIIDETMIDLIQNEKISKGNLFYRLSDYERIRLNLLKTYQYKGEKLMEDNIEIIQSKLIEKLNTKDKVPSIENDMEYYFLMGQVLYFFSTISNRETSKQLAEILKIKNAQKAKKYVDSLVTKNVYKMDKFSYKLRNAISCIYSYEPKKYDRDSLVVGLCLANNIFYKKNENNEEVEEEIENEE